MSSGNDGVIRFGCDFERDEFKLRNLRAEAFSQLGRGLSAAFQTLVSIAKCNMEIGYGLVNDRIIICS